MPRKPQIVFPRAKISKLSGRACPQSPLGHLSIHLYILSHILLSWYTITSNVIESTAPGHNDDDDDDDYVPHDFMGYIEVRAVNLGINQKRTKIAKMDIAVIIYKLGT